MNCLIATATPPLHTPARNAASRFSAKGNSLFIIFALILAVGMAGTSTATAEEQAPPNVIFILVDDLGMMDLEPYNPDTFHDTPNISRLAGQGMLFKQAYGSNPVCSPTRLSVMTGHYPSRHDATNWFCGVRHETFRSAEINCFMPTNLLTMGQAFQQHDYVTYFAGKWHLGPDEEHWPENRGFNYNIGGWKAGSPSAHGGGGYFSPYNNPRLPDGPDGEFLTDRLVDETTAFLRKYQDKPFFAILSFYQVHTPLQAPDELVAKYRQRAKEQGLDQLKDEQIFAEEEQVWPTNQPRRVRVRQTHAVYAAMVESMDTAVGRILDALDELDLAENTIIVFTSDDGGLATSEGHPTANLPLRGGKGWLYEGGLRNPLIMRWPGEIPSDTTTDGIVMNTDFFPTLLDLAGLPLEKEHHVDGVSFKSLVTNPQAQSQWDRGPIFWHYPHYSNQGGFPGGAIRLGQWKLIERYEDGRVHLYDMQNDIGEQNDLAEEQPDRVQQLRGLLHEWYDEVDARFLRPRDGAEPWHPDDARK